MMYIWRNDIASKKVIILAVTHATDNGIVRNILDLGGNVIAGSPAWIDASLKTITFETWVEEYFLDLDRYRFPLKSTAREKMLSVLKELFVKVNVEIPDWIKEC